MVFLGLNLLFKDKIRFSWFLDLGIGFLKVESPHPYEDGIVVNQEIYVDFISPSLSMSLWCSCWGLA